MQTCSICGQAAQIRASVEKGLIIEGGECPRCGKWWFALDLVGSAIRGASPELKAGLAAHIRAANDSGQRVVELNPDNWLAYATQHAFTPVPRKLDLLLQWYERRSSYAGDWVVDEPYMYPLVDARNQAEVAFLRHSLVGAELLENRPNKPNTDYRITAKGWEHLHPHAPGGVPGTCFVAMSFDATLDEAYDFGIRPAVEDDCRFKVVRVDRVEHNENINDKILADIRAAQFLVADFTHHRNGVYFEAGFALGLGRVVIWTCRRDDFNEKVHFDTRPYNHILWTTPAALRQKLKDRIRATIANTSKMQD